MEYPKIHTVWKRAEAKPCPILEGQFARPEFEYLKNNDWVWTEKVDGTNIRVFWDGAKVRFAGRTDNAQIPATLVERLYEMFTPDIMRVAFPDGAAILFGEGYGAGIQKGGNYLPNGQSFILFDVWRGIWLERDNVVDIGHCLGIKVVPIVSTGPLLEAVAFAKHATAMQFRSITASNLSYVMEGLVMRPKTELQNRRGERIIAKIKRRDFRAQNVNNQGA